MTDWEHDALRDSILAGIVAQMPPPPKSGDFTKQQFIDATGLSAPTAEYRLKNMVRDGVLETQECTIDGRTVRVWRKPS
jgi:hypothetical protein